MTTVETEGACDYVGGKGECKLQRYTNQITCSLNKINSCLQDMLNDRPRLIAGSQYNTSSQCRQLLNMLEPTH